MKRSLSLGLADSRYRRPQHYSPNGALGALAAALSGLTSTGLIVCSDSTGNETTEWVYLLGQKIASHYPNWTVRYRLFDDGTQAYGDPTTIQTGSDGLRYIDTGASGLGITLADSYVTHVSGDIDVRVNAELLDWSNGSTQMLLAHWGADTNRSWSLAVSSTGLPNFVYSADGSANTSKFATANPNFTDGQRVWLRVTMDMDDGGGNNVIRFYQSSDGVTWTQIGADVTTAGALGSGLFNSTANYELGIRNGGSPANGKFYAAEVRDGIGGMIVSPLLIESWRPNSAHTVGGSPTLEILNASVAGKTISYFTDGTRKTKVFKDNRPAAVIVSLGHNHQDETDSTWRTALDSILTEIRSLAPGAVPVFLTQSPQVSPGTYGRYMSIRRAETIAWGQNNDVAVIDTYQAFLSANGTVNTSLIDADGVHHASGGKAATRDAIWSVLDGRT